MSRWQMLLLAALVARPLLAQRAGPDSLTVVLDGRATVLRRAELASLPHAGVTIPAGEGDARTFTGIPLRAVLERAGFDTAQVYGPALGGTMLVVARDGYRVAFGLSDLDSAITGRALLLAGAMDGQALDERRGPWQLVVPGDRHGRRSVRQVVEIRIVRPEE